MMKELVDTIKYRLALDWAFTKLGNHLPLSVRDRALITGEIDGKKVTKRKPEETK